MFTQFDAEELVDDMMKPGFEHLRDEAIREVLQAKSYGQAESWVRQLFDEAASETAEANDFEERTHLSAG